MWRGRGLGTRGQGDYHLPTPHRVVASFAMKQVVTERYSIYENAEA